MNYAVLSLQDKESWLPEALLYTSFSWPTLAFPTTALRNLVLTLTPETFAAPGTATITPPDIDPTFGGLRRRHRNYAGPAFQVRAGGDGLAPGDLLIPNQPSVPVLRMRPEHIGSLVAGTFLAVRPDTGLSEWLWGVLSSRSGISARASLSSGSVMRTLRRTDVLDMDVPVPPLEYISRRLADLNTIEDSTVRVEEEPASSWWTTTCLDSGDWHLKTSTPDPAPFDDAVLLQDLCSEIQAGRRARDHPDGAGGTEPVPLATVSTLSGRKTPEQVPTNGAVLAMPGDILVARVGTRPYATPIDTPTAAGDGLWVLRIDANVDANAISRFLNSAAGVSMRRMLTTRTTVPSINRTALGKMPIPRAALRDTTPIAPPHPLATELEQVLWS